VQGLDGSGTGQEQVADSCENCNEPSDSMYGEGISRLGEDLLLSQELSFSMELAHEMTCSILQSGVHIFCNVFFVILYISFKFMLALEYSRTVCS